MEGGGFPPLPCSCEGRNKRKNLPILYNKKNYLLNQYISDKESILKSVNLSGTFGNCRTLSNSGHPSLYPLFPTPSHQRAFSAAAAEKKGREINPFSHPPPFSRSNAQENTQGQKENNFPGKRKGANTTHFREKK